jgi:hypothetical protein
MMHFERRYPGRQTLTPTREPGDSAPTILGVQKNARIAASRLGVGRQQRLDASAEIRHRRIGIAHGARRAHRRTSTAAHAQVRLDRDVVAVGANRQRRADVDALVATGLLRSAVRADRCLVIEIFWLLEFTDHEGELGGRLRLRDGIDAR